LLDVTMTSQSTHDSRPMMRLCGPAIQDTCSELRVLERLLPLEGAQILELGCGAAEKTRLLAERCGVAHIVAAEVDRIQHQKNLTITDLPKVTFESFGAEAIPFGDNEFDVVLMFKSLHHVPLAQLQTALQEICRVLKPGGLAYISEPVFEGPFNDIMQLFHNEEIVRKAAFDAVTHVVENGTLELAEEYFFRNAIRFRSFEQFAEGVMNVTHSDYTITPDVYEEVRSRFMQHASPEGFAFEIPNRIDLLRKPV
ncbi:MAG: class I SAM-dependent methyltransferase, partial [Pseudomonadales bacterium]|nr:class I SAM-dependent methyltransferase [Pseudomonadales bacterium]